jgi:hypothetical protein
VPTKDEVQDEIARMQSLEIKTTIKKDTTLNFAVWQENRTCEAFLMHVTVVLDAIKKRGHVKDCEMAAKEYEGAKKTVNSLTAIDGHNRQYFNELRSTVVSCRIFIRLQSLIAH